MPLETHFFLNTFLLGFMTVVNGKDLIKFLDLCNMWQYCVALQDQQDQSVQ